MKEKIHKIIRGKIQFFRRLNQFDNNNNNFLRTKFYKNTHHLNWSYPLLTQYFI